MAEAWRRESKAGGAEADPATTPTYNRGSAAEVNMSDDLMDGNAPAAGGVNNARARIVTQHLPTELYLQGAASLAASGVRDMAPIRKMVKAKLRKAVQG